MGRLKLGRLSMPAPKTVVAGKRNTLTVQFGYEHGFALRSFQVNDGWCRGAHPLLGVQEASLIGALTGDTSCVYETLENALFVDTETTGLGYGAGTFAFLVGVAYRRVDGWIGGVVLIKFPGGFRVLETVRCRVSFYVFFVYISGPRFCRPFVVFGTSFGISFRAFVINYVFKMRFIICGIFDGLGLVLGAGFGAFVFNYVFKRWVQK